MTYLSWELEKSTGEWTGFHDVVESRLNDTVSVESQRPFLDVVVERGVTRAKSFGP